MERRLLHRLNAGIPIRDAEARELHRLSWGRRGPMVVCPHFAWGHRGPRELSGADLFLSEGLAWGRCGPRGLFDKSPWAASAPQT